ncbi:hypothetical protein [Clostridium manihotivorum]|uniref:Uncharacterized protein n=1 Tax=Clostridium manihotivorum TaxID=2320868 RepID=A0A410DQ94_9CLOT|nr:hypothetical protein [Clostridium manihotivorum]QAA31228.1 hypothetical protein C1I91_05975 [Clostridium manihotivorum]
MNLLECYIKEVKSIKPCKEEWTKKFNKKFLTIKVVVNCYGNIQKHETVESEEDWKKIKERGYFLW